MMHALAGKGQLSRQMRSALQSSSRNSCVAQNVVPLTSSICSPPTALPRGILFRRNALSNRQHSLGGVVSRAATDVASPSKAPPREQVFTSDPANNVSDYVYEKMGMVLHQQPDHPICIIKQVRSVET